MRIRHHDTPAHNQHCSSHRPLLNRRAGAIAAPSGIICPATTSVPAALAAMVLAKRRDRTSPMPTSRLQQEARTRPTPTSGTPKTPTTSGGGGGGSAQKYGSRCPAPRGIGVVSSCLTPISRQTKERRIAYTSNFGPKRNRTIPGRAHHNTDFGPTSGPKPWANEHSESQLVRPPSGWASKAHNISKQEPHSAIDKRMPCESKPAARTHENRHKRNLQDNANDNGDSDLGPKRRAHMHTRMQDATMLKGTHKFECKSMLHTYTSGARRQHNDMSSPDTLALP